MGPVRLRKLAPIVVPTALLMAAILVAPGIGDFAGARRDAHPGGEPRRPAASFTAIPLPPVMLWAWERPEDLSFLDSRRVGVAFLAGTIDIGAPPADDASATGISVVLHPRLEPLVVPPGTALVAVLRIETPNDVWRRARWLDRASSPPRPIPADEAATRLRVADMLVSVAGQAGVRAVQVDFDASASDRPFYRQLLEETRRRLPAGIPLSITALASWCLGDAWLDALPAGTIDEAVPMLFRMGRDGARVAAYLQDGMPFPSPACRGSVGVSTDESFSRALLAGGEATTAAIDPSRVYVFSNRPWTKAGVEQILAEVAKWDHGLPESR